MSAGAKPPKANLWQLLAWTFGRRTRYTVFGNSMMPTLQNSQEVLAKKTTQYTVGDLVIVKHPRQSLLLIKRIFEIQDNKVFLLGDNAKESTDSKIFGPIPTKDIAGLVTAILPSKVSER